MADSQLVSNSNSGSSSEERKNFVRRLPYDPAVLKRQGLWSKDKLGSKDMFGRMGGNNRDSQASTMMTHQGDRKENPPDSKHKAGDTQKYNSDSRSHGARGNNDAGVDSKTASTQYGSQSIHKGSGSLDSASGGRSYNSDSRSHGARDNNGQGVRTQSASVQYPSQAIRNNRRAGLANAQNGTKWNSDSRSHSERDGHHFGQRS